MSLPGYDSWKLATPPDPDEEAGLRECSECSRICPVECLNEESTCPDCLQDDGSGEEDAAYLESDR